MAQTPSRTVVVRGKTAYALSVAATGCLLIKRRVRTQSTAHNFAREGMIPAKVIYRIKELR